MRIHVLRYFGTETETISRVYLGTNSTLFGYILEDAVTEHKIPGRSCIPAGNYKIRVTYSARFGKMMPLIYNDHETLKVTDICGCSWSGIRIHGGNTHLNSSGCLILAEKVHIGVKSNYKFEGKHIMNWVSGCSNINNKLIKMLGDEEHDLVIKYDQVPYSICAKLQSPMMKSREIALIQMVLVDNGYDITIDGIYGPKSAEAVRSFQEKNNLPIDGVVTRDLYNLLVSNVELK